VGVLCLCSFAASLPRVSLQHPGQPLCLDGPSRLLAARLPLSPTPASPFLLGQGRVLHGVRPEILALTEVPFVKAYTARLLYRAGLRWVPPDSSPSWLGWRRSQLDWAGAAAAAGATLAAAQLRIQALYTLAASIARHLLLILAPPQDPRVCGGCGERGPARVHPAVGPAEQQQPVSWGAAARSSAGCTPCWCGGTGPPPAAPPLLAACSPRACHRCTALHCTL
jgi:hypothetical protein